MIQALSEGKFKRDVHQVIGRCRLYLNNMAKLPSVGAFADISHRKLVIIGDGACGKTSLLSVFTLGYFPTVRHLALIQLLVLIVL